ncbi:MAG: flagellar biosynthetic protein FliO [Methylococcaceae bacterium]|nr:flagellar biosynthetic protein FliO [Methylococcaceae bacterium]
MRVLIASIIIFLFSISSTYAAMDIDGMKPTKVVTSDHVMSWALGLIIVIALFFACIWLMRKMGALPENSKQKMRVIAGLSLGGREKVMLVQVGEKQIVLGVSPGRINNLLVLEENDRVVQEVKERDAESEFSQKLKQIMTGTLNE